MITSGEQTEITPEILNIAKELPGLGLDFVVETMVWVKQNVPIPFDLDRGKKDNLFRKRTAEQIISDKFSTGCTDTTLAFLVLCRAKGIDAKYVEAIDKEWLRTGGPSILGHVFSEVLINYKWYQVDPTRGLIFAYNDIKSRFNYEIFGVGLDSWDLGIRNMNDLKKKFEAFRTKIPF